MGLVDVGDEPGELRFNHPTTTRVEQFHHGSRCRVRVRPDDDRPDVFMRPPNSRSRRRSTSRFAVVTPFPNTPLYKKLEARHPRRTELYDAARGFSQST
jgi:hypothetical protein